MKKSETYDRNNIEQSKKSSNFLESGSENIDNENPYMSEFENLIYEENEPEKDALALNDSFEEFEKKSRSEK